MSRARVFLDTGIFIAARNARDRHHAQARALFGGPTPRWFTSVLVLAEAYAWFLHKHGEEAARRFRLLVANLDGLVVLDTDGDHREAVWQMLDRMRGTRLTYVDASSLVFLEHHDIATVWATDRHLGITGAEVLPRS